MRRTPRVIASVSLCLLALAGGCDSEDGGDGTLPSVTIREFNKKCDEVAAWAETQKLTDDEACTNFAYEAIFEALASAQAAPADAEVRQFCQEAKTACANALKMNAAMPSTMTTPMERPMCEVPPSTCTATLAEWDACQRTIPAQVKRFLAGLPACDRLTAADLLEIATGTKFDVEDSPACKTLEMKCSEMAPPSMSSMMMKK